MVVSFEFSGEVCVLRLEGRFATGLDQTYLRGRADELRHLDYRKVAVDFTGVSYIDSTGIGFLISVYTIVTQEKQGAFALAGTNRRVQEVLRLTKMTTIMKSYADLAAAVAALASA